MFILLSFNTFEVGVGGGGVKIFCPFFSAKCNQTCTGVSTKDETSEAMAIVKNFFNSFPCIQGALKSKLAYFHA